MTENCPMRHENGNCIPAGGFCTANKNICEALLNAYKMGKAQLSQEGTTSDLIDRQAALDIFDDYNVSVENGELEAYSRDRKRMCELPPAQPEPAIPLSWIEKHIEWHKSLDNEFANLAAAHISVMVKKWRDEQNEQH